MRKSLMLGVLLLIPNIAQAVCTPQSTGINICIPNFNDSGDVWGQDMQTAFELINDDTVSVILQGPLTISTTKFAIHINTGTGGIVLSTITFNPADGSLGIFPSLGLGTTAPAFILHTFGSGASGIIRIDRDDGEATIGLRNLESGSTDNPIGNIQMHGKDNTGQVKGIVEILGFQTGATFDDSYIVFKTAIGAVLLEQMRIDSAGNVGIGTASPRSRLDVLGDVKISSAVTAASGTFTTGLLVGTTDFLIFAQDADDSTGTLRTDVDAKFATAGGSITGQTTVEGSSLTVDGALLVTGNTTLGNTIADTLTLTVSTVVVSATSGITFSTSTDVDTDIIAHFDGINNRVGIGTEVPGAAMHTFGAGSNGGIRIERNDGDAFVDLRNLESGSDGNAIGAVNMRAKDSGGTVRNIIRIRGFQAGANFDDSYITFETASGGTMSEVFRIDENGNVGIGTTSPAKKLQVNSNGGEIKLKSFNDIAHYGIYRYNVNSLNPNNIIGGIKFYGSTVGGDEGSGAVGLGAEIRAVADASFGSNDAPTRLEFRTSLDGTVTPVTHLTIDNAGNVGISSSTPTQLLSVNLAFTDGLTWVDASDPSAKTHISKADSQQYDNVLASLEATPMNNYRWKKKEQVGERYVTSTSTNIITFEDENGDMQQKETYEVYVTTIPIYEMIEDPNRKPELGIYLPEAPAEIVHPGGGISGLAHRNFNMAAIKALLSRVEQLEQRLAVLE